MTDSLPPVPPRTAADGSTVHDGISYRLVPGHRPLLLDLRVPAGPGPHPVVLWLHGGGFFEGDRRYLPSTMIPGSLFDALVGEGLAVATADYRLSGEARFPAQRDDACAAIEYLRAYAGVLGLDPERVGVWGESAGGALAACVALLPSTRVAAAAAWYAPTRVEREPLPPDATPVGDPTAALLGGPAAERPELASQLDLAAQVTPAAPPFLLVHGTADSLVPAEHGERLHRALLAAGRPSEFLPVPGAGHCFEGCDDIPGLTTFSARFLARTLRAAAV